MFQEQAAVRGAARSVSVRSEEDSLGEYGKPAEQ